MINLMMMMTICFTEATRAVRKERLRGQPVARGGAATIQNGKDKLLATTTPMKTSTRTTRRRRRATTTTRRRSRTKPTTKSRTCYVSRAAPSPKILMIINELFIEQFGDNLQQASSSKVNWLYLV